MRGRLIFGFTLLEVLVAASLALVLLGSLTLFTSTSLKIQRRENQNVPVQQSLRASVEVIAQDLRSAVGLRVTYSGQALPNGVPVSSANTLVILVPVDNTTFQVPSPTGYPLSRGIAARYSTPLSPTTLESTTATCNTVFSSDSSAGQTSVYGMFYSTLDTNQQANGTRSPDNSQLFQISSTTPCIASGSGLAVNHPSNLLPSVTSWNPNTYIVEVQPIVYTVIDGNLTRKIIGIDVNPQIVAYGISNLSVSYLADNNPGNPPVATANCNSSLYVSNPSCVPRSVNVSLTSTPQNASVTGTNNLTASQIVFMR